MELLTLKDAAERVGCSTKTLRNRIKSGELRALMKEGKHGPTYFVPEAELVRMLAMEAPGGRSPSSATLSSTTPVADSTASTVAGQGSSAVVEAQPTAATAAVAGVSADVILRLTDRLEQQAHELGRFKAITERAESLETRERQLQEERDRLALELAATKAELDVMRREQLRNGKRWFGLKRGSRVQQGSSTVENAGVR